MLHPYPSFPMPSIPQISPQPIHARLLDPSSFPEGTVIVDEELIEQNGFLPPSVIIGGRVFMVQQIEI
jgi:hypothetical protein